MNLVNTNIFRKAVAVITILSLLLLMSCNNKDSCYKEKSSKVSSKTEPEDYLTNPDSSSSIDIKREVKKNTVLDSFNTKETKISVRSDYNEDIPDVNCASLLKNLNGYANNQANALRNEIIGTGNTSKYYKISGTVYYISPGGNDENDGKTPETALRSIDKINNLLLKYGDAVLFERNSVFRQKSVISCVSGVTYGSYGSGFKPTIYACSKKYADATIWKPSNKKYVWVTESGYDTICNIVFNHGEQVGYMKDNVQQLSKNTDYYCNEYDAKTYLYYDKGNPGNAFSDIELCEPYFNFLIPDGTNNVTIDNLCLKYATAGAISAQCFVKGLVITNCEIGFSGGTNKNSVVRMGNAIGMWYGSEKIKVNHNWIYQTFDSAISPQGNGGKKVYYKNISFCNNLLEYNNSDFEWFDSSGSSWSDFQCNGNIMRFTSLGWGTRLDDAGIRGIEGCIRANTTDQIVKNFSFKNNIIDCPGKEIINWSSNFNSLEEYHIEKNTVFVKYTYRMIYPNAYKAIIGFFTGVTTNKGLYVNSQTELENAWKTWDKSTTSKVFWYE